MKSKHARRIFTEDEIKWARSARTARRPWRDIGKHLHCEWDTIKRILVPGFAEQRTAQIREARALRTGKTSGINPMVANRRPTIPPEIETDRHDRASAPRTLTAILCGDPAPGQSMLDKKRSGAMP